MFTAPGSPLLLSGAAPLAGEEDRPHATAEGDAEPEELAGPLLYPCVGLDAHQTATFTFAPPFAFPLEELGRQMSNLPTTAAYYYAAFDGYREAMEAELDADTEELFDDEEDEEDDDEFDDYDEYDEYDDAEAEGFFDDEEALSSLEVAGVGDGDGEDEVAANYYY